MAKVFLVGAGPSDPNLLTVRALRLIQTADIIVYDALVSPQILQLIPHNTKKIYVGKRAGQHAHSQEEINQILVNLGQDEKGAVVRLKGGDPFVFGRGGEEMQALREAQIPYEVVSGITAGVAAPAYCGIPVTHRGLSQSLTLITAFTREGGVPSLDWEALARLGGTLVFYMGMRTLPIIAKQLQKHGLDGNTPAGIISQGTSPRQREHFAQLKDFTEDYLDYENFTPALFMVGKVIQLGKEHSRFNRGALAGQRILVTRSVNQSSRLQDLLNAEGVETIFLPTIDIRSIEDNKKFEEAVHKLSTYTWLLLTSVNAVQIFMDKLLAMGFDSRALAHLKLACVGKATSEELRKYGLIADFIPQSYTAKDMANDLIELGLVKENDRLLLPQSSISNQAVQQTMEEHSIVCDSLAIYENIAISYDDEALKDIFSKPLDWLTFCSSSAVHNFFNLVDKHGLSEQVKGIKLAAIGEVTAKTIEDLGYPVSAMPSQASIPALVETIKNY